MGSNTENVIDTLFNTILSRIQQAMKTSNERGSGFTHDGVRRGESYIVSPDWIASKKATVNTKPEENR